TRLSQLRDGASNTIAILGACGDAGPWAAGGRATARALTQRPYVNGPDGFGTGQPDGMYVGMADGSVRFLAKDVDPRIVEELVTINGGEKSREPVDAKEPAEAAQAQAPETKPATDDEANEVEEKEPTAEEIPPALATKLARPIEDAKFEDMELGDLVQLVREMGSLEIQIDQASLAKAEVSLDTSVTVELKKTTLGDVLDEALRQCGLALVAREGRLVVTVAEP
ncbi:MAG TPA: DUF1559 domain-containing protein, partial [Thermoguttaceae bacterium]|nr:DUF1559 domain-containing protein [Thermoguttaceae bacterium]